MALETGGSRPSVILMLKQFRQVVLQFHRVLLEVHVSEPDRTPLVSQHFDEKIRKAHAVVPDLNPLFTHISSEG